MGFMYTELIQMYPEILRFPISMGRESMVVGM